MIKRSVPATVPASDPVSIDPVLVAKNGNSFMTPLQVIGDGKNADKNFTMNTLIDSGAQGKFLDKKFTIKNRIAMTKLMKPITAHNVDGTENKSGKIKYST